MGELFQKCHYQFVSTCFCDMPVGVFGVSCVSCRIAWDMLPSFFHHLLPIFLHFLNKEGGERVEWLSSSEFIDGQPTFDDIGNEKSKNY